VIGEPVSGRYSLQTDNVEIPWAVNAVIYPGRTQQGDFRLPPVHMFDIDTIRALQSLDFTLPE
jgi:hypothetical protein